MGHTRVYVSSFISRKNRNSRTRGHLQKSFLKKSFLKKSFLHQDPELESKMQPTDSTLVFKVYVVTSRNRLIEGMARGGGLLTLVRNDLKYRVVDSPLAVLNVGLEELTVDAVTSIVVTTMTNEWGHGGLLHVGILLRHTGWAASSVGVTN
jgi:hypothetical protein